VSEAEHESHRRRRTSAHERAAEVHEQAAVTHERAAAFFEEHDRPEKVLHEHDLADDEAAKAADAREVAEADAED
jgi:hypothetical protein